jgi:hypothetical protein
MATVTSTGGTPTGTVTFMDGATTLGTGTLNASAQATFTTTTLTAGANSITAVYGGSSNFAGSTSTAVTQTVNASTKSASSTAVTSSLNPSPAGQSVTFTATVTSTAAGTPTGTVTFLDGATTLGSGTLNNSAQAALAISTLTAGAHSITAVYGGDSNFTGSTSAALAQTVTNTIAAGGNVASVIVDSGPYPSNPTVNVAFTTVVVCAPGTANCVTIDHVAIDTGSIGLRIPASVFATLTNGSTVLAALPNVNTSTPVAECYSFISGDFFWGGVRSADVQMGGTNNTGETASGVPIQVIGDPSMPTVPGDCTGTQVSTGTQLGTNGLLGVGNYQYDCDFLGSTNVCISSSTAPLGFYYSCTGSSCIDSPAPSVPLTEQVRNPVSKFATDNNGVILELPSVPAGGESGISSGASLVFGIGTAANNGLSSSVTVLPLDANPNDPAYLGFTTVYNGVSYPNSLATYGSFLDSGSNGIFFLDEPTSLIPNCTVNTDWYCPATTETLTATNEATGGNSTAVTFDVANADSLFTTSNTAFSDLTGPNTPGTPNVLTQAGDAYFDWGLSFFYGRNVYTSIWGATEPSPPVSGITVPAGPFWAY